MIRLFTKGKTLSKGQATALVKRFFDGDTTVAEEQQLYNYFASGKAHSSLKQYAPMFGWYANELQTPAKPKVHRWRYIAAAAAAVGVIATVGIHQYNASSLTDEEQRLAEIYAGSYIIRNGKKITDMKEVLPVILQQEKERKNLLAKIDKYKAPEFDFDRPTAEDLFSDIEDEYVRNEMIKFYLQNQENIEQ